MTPLPNRQIKIGVCRELLATLPDDSIDCVVTSPPYWGLRDYGVEGQLGLEPTPELFVARLVDVFRQVRRVLKPTGTLWLNLGDSYAQSGRGGIGEASTLGGSRHNQEQSRIARAAMRVGAHTGNAHQNAAARTPARRAPEQLRPKDLVGIPWRVAFALQADGWILRSDIIWSKPNPMPESVQDRPTKAHEYVFLLAKSERYFYDAAAIKEPVSGTAHARGHGFNPKAKRAGKGTKQNGSMSQAIAELVDERNKRSVWTIGSEAYSEAHFATFPTALVEPCILAGAPAGGLVLDPFGGSGTVAQVAEQLGRRWMLMELNPEYAALARRRTRQRGLFADLAPRQNPCLESLSLDLRLTP